MDVFTVVDQTGRKVIWSDLSGKLGRRECGQLLYLIEGVIFPPGTQVVLDFSQAHHIDYRVVPLLIQMARKIERRSGAFSIAGVTEYLRFIMELGSALEGREFIEEHTWSGTLIPTGVNNRCRKFRLGDLGDLLPSGRGGPCAN